MNSYSLALEKRRLGKTELEVSALGIGAAEIGYHVSEATVDSIVGQALDAGCSLIDTAAMYGSSEELLGRVLRGRRDRFVVMTKCGLCLPPKRTPLGFALRASRKVQRWRGKEVSFEWLPSTLIANIHESLRRLQTDRLDVIQLHSCPEEVLQRDEVLEVLFRARRAGKVRYIGYSGDGDVALHAIQSRRFDVLQISVNIADQDAIDTAVPLARELGMGVVAKRPIANGLWRASSRPDAAQNRPYWDRLQELRYEFLAEEEAFETALRFTLSVPGVDTAIAGTGNPAHFGENVRIAALGPLEVEQYRAIRSRWLEVAQADWGGQT